MKKLDYPRDMYARRPVDKTSAMAMSSGVHYEWASPSSDRATNDLPIPTKDPPPKALDLTGLSLGRLVVVGYHRTKNKQSSLESHSWVVRCACGMYETRTSKSILRTLDGTTILKEGFQPMCQRCESTYRMRRGRS